MEPPLPSPPAPVERPPPLLPPPPSASTPRLARAASESVALDLRVPSDQTALPAPFAQPPASARLAGRTPSQDATGGVLLSPAGTFTVAPTWPVQPLGILDEEDDGASHAVGDFPGDGSARGRGSLAVGPPGPLIWDTSPSPRTGSNPPAPPAEAIELAPLPPAAVLMQDYPPDSPWLRLDHAAGEDGGSARHLLQRLTQPLTAELDSAAGAGAAATEIAMSHDEEDDDDHHGRHGRHRRHSCWCCRLGRPLHPPLAPGGDDEHDDGDHDDDGRPTWRKRIVGFLLDLRTLATLKESFAFLVCFVPQLIPPLAEANGQQAYLSTFAVVMGLVSGSVGRNVVNTLSIILGVLVGGAAGMAVVMAANDSMWVLVLGLFLLDFAFNLVRALKPAAGLAASLATMTLIIVIIQTADGRVLHPEQSVAEIGSEITLTTINVYSLGAVLALLVSVLVFPRKASYKFRDQMALVLSEVSDMLAASTMRLRDPNYRPALRPACGRLSSGRAKSVRQASASHLQNRRWDAWMSALRERWRLWEGSSTSLRQSDGEYDDMPATLGEGHVRHGSHDTMARRLSIATEGGRSLATSGADTTGAATSVEQARRTLLSALRECRQAATALTDVLNEAQWEFGLAFYHRDYHDRIVDHLRHMVRVACAIESEEFHSVLDANGSPGPDGTGTAAVRRGSLVQDTPRGGDSGSCPLPTVTVSAVPPDSARRWSPGPSPRMTPRAIGADVAGEPASRVDLSAAGIMATTLPLAQLQATFEQYALDLVMRLYDGTSRSAAAAASPSPGVASLLSSASVLSWFRSKPLPTVASQIEIDAGMEDLHSILREYDRRLQETSIWIADDRAALFRASPVKGKPAKRSKVPDLEAAAAVGGLPYKLMAIRELLLEMLLLIETIREMHEQPRRFWTSLGRMLRSTMHIGPNHRQPASLSPGYMGATEPDHTRWRYRIWHAATLLASPAVKYSLKTSLSIALVGLISFHKSASEVFRVWRGLWALITISVVSSPTFGGNLENSFYRIIGTVVAAVWAVIVESAFPLNIVALVCFTTLFVVPATYLRLGGRFRKVGLQALSAFVSIQLAFVADRDNPPIWTNIYELAYKRALAIVVGVLVALISGRLVWPRLSRVEMRRTLANAIRELSEVYSVLQGSIERQLVKLQEDLPAIKVMESEVQRAILQAEDLLAIAETEPRLKGPLPTILYDRLLQHTQRALDQLTLLRTLLTRGAGWELHQDLADHTTLARAALQERREQTVNMQLYFFLLETAIATKRPLLYHMPDITRSVQRAFRKWRKHVNGVAYQHRGQLSPPPVDSGDGAAAAAAAAAVVATDVSLGAAASLRPLSVDVRVGSPLPGDSDFGTVLVTAYAVALLDLARTLELMGADTKALFGVNAYVHYGPDFRKLSFA